MADGVTPASVYVRANKDVLKYSYFPRTIADWNCFHEQILHSSSLDSFKSNLAGVYSREEDPQHQQDRRKRNNFKAAELTCRNSVPFQCMVLGSSYLLARKILALGTRTTLCI